MTKKTKDNAPFAEGDAVTLSVGGPPMAVHAVKGSQITCDWFNGKTLCRKPFNRKELIPSAGEEMSKLEMARQLVFMLREGMKEIEQQKSATSAPADMKVKPEK